MLSVVTVCYNAIMLGVASASIVNQSVDMSSAVMPSAVMLNIVIQVS